MKTIKHIMLIMGIAIANMTYGQQAAQGLKESWQIGFGLGEIPTGGSFKPSITVGYYFTENLYSGIIYQKQDHISRDGSSFNAKSSGLEGLLDASEAVAQRFLFQVRYQPFSYGLYLSGGFVYNGEDTETMLFDDRVRQIGERESIGSIEIQQTRPAGWGLAAGIGFQHNFKNGFSAGFEWTPAWGQYPDPSYKFAGDADLSEDAIGELSQKMNDGFKSSVTNMYKVFHFGIAYRFRSNN